jgi:hypothetical protein
VIIEPVEDLDVAAVGQGPVGDIGLPAFIGLLGLETDVGAFGPFTRPRGDQGVVVQDAPDRRRHLPAGEPPWIPVQR